MSFLFGRTLRSLYVFAIACSAASGQVVTLSNFAAEGRSVQRSTITEFNGSVYFGVAVDDTNERELWRFDGNSPQLVADGFTGTSELAISQLTEYQNQLYFSANANGSGQELYRLNNGQAELVADMAPGAASSFPVGLTVHNGDLYFSAKQGESFNHLWKFDGQKTSIVSAFDNPRASVVPGVTYRGDLYFGADDGGVGMELWKYDGTGVQPIADINAGPNHSFPHEFEVIGDTLYFKATTQEYGQEVFQYDGEEVTIFQDVFPGPKSSDPRNLTEVNGALFYSAVAWGRRAVYEHDGTFPRQVLPGGGPLQVGDDIYTIRGRYVNGIEINELYSLDGQFFRSLVPSAGPFETMNGNLFFSCACDGRELYMLATTGDTNADGDVDVDDFLTLSRNFGGTGGGWTMGDFDGNGIVEVEDFLVQSRNFGASKRSRRANAPVPEPSSLLGVWFAVLGGLATRRRRAQKDT